MCTAFPTNLSQAGRLPKMYPIGNRVKSFCSPYLFFFFLQSHNTSLIFNIQCRYMHLSCYIVITSCRALYNFILHSSKPSLYIQLIYQFVLFNDHAIIYCFKS